MLMSGDEDWTHDIAHAGETLSTGVRNRYIARRRLLWQSGAVRPAIEAEVTVMSLNPRIISNWFVLARPEEASEDIGLGARLAARGRDDPTEGSRRDPATREHSDRVHGAEARELREHRPGADVVAASNGLYRVRRDGSADSTQTATDVVCVGRINRSKKPVLLARRVSCGSPSLPGGRALVFVGDGPLKRRPRQRANGLGGDRVVFTGHVSDVEETAAPLYGGAIVSVSPGYVGLSLIQSLGQRRSRCSSHATSLTRPRSKRSSKARTELFDERLPGRARALAPRRHRCRAPELDVATAG